MDIQRHLQMSNELIRWLDERIEGLEVPSTDRVRIGAGCLDLALEHQKAIVTLTDSQLHGSAAALVRLIFEAYIRGIWFLFCASDTEIDLFKVQDKIAKNFGGLISDLEKLPAYDVGVLSQVKASSWGSMNSLTHAGFSQVVRRNTADSITPNHTDAEIIDALTSANTIAIFAAVEVANLAGNESLVLEFAEKSKEYSGIAL